MMVIHIHEWRDKSQGLQFLIKSPKLGIVNTIPGDVDPQAVIASGLKEWVIFGDKDPG